jgi:hypothetical protein
VKLCKHGPVQLLRSQAGHATANSVAEALPEQIGTGRDRTLLAAIGLDQARLAAHPAAASIHPTG